ncbi:hypothetical protein [Candidatus Borrarchaeum sp.]|uniref:hypothetical protein n=1 Tax=Candidatus Borrarchaeum sp. TaxID=2846742 RepID=UPI00257EC6B3|nr:hypothetical protein [Candidatus Borrarchaeum sp.]
MDGKIPRKNWVMIPYSKVYIDYKRWKDIAARRMISVTKYSEALSRALIESETSLGYLVWVAKEQYKGTLYLRYACECSHFKMTILPAARNKFATIKINGDYAILVDEWHNLDKHAYVAASKLLDIKIPVALPLEQLVDFRLIEAGRYNNRFQKLGITTLLELANQQESPEVDEKVKEFKSLAKRLLESIDLIELQKDVFVAFDNELKLQ